MRVWYGMYFEFRVFCLIYDKNVLDDIMALSVLLTLCVGKPWAHRWIPLTKGQSCGTFIVVLCCWTQLAEQKIELPVIADAVIFIWRHCNYVMSQRVRWICGMIRPDSATSRVTNMSNTITHLNTLWKHKIHLHVLTILDFGTGGCTLRTDISAIGILRMNM